jgi:hypothetical protein
MSIELGFIFTVFTVAKSASGTLTWAADLPHAIQRLLGAVDSLDEKIDRMLKADLNAGFSSLDQAARATVERVHLLREARNCFNLASTKETGYRQGLALLGLAVCHHLLGDRANCQHALERLVQLPPALGEWSVVASLLRTVGPQPDQSKDSYYYERIKSAIDRSQEARSLDAIQKAATTVLATY